MDAMQFGRWFSDRRRTRGWTSQRALIESVRGDAVLGGAGISEDFVARLEAGKVVFPLRGRVRRRVLLLARALCASPSDLRSYLRAAEIHSLSPAEEETIASVRAYLTARIAAPPRLLPRRPPRLFGREADLAQLVTALASGNDDLYCLTGMPGVGKSALAHEAVHALTDDAEGRWMQRFPDGVAVFTCLGRHGPSGLAALLDDVCDVFAAPKTASTRKIEPSLKIEPSGRRLDTTEASGGPQAELSCLLAHAVDRARLALSRTRTLIVLDDVDPRLPLDRALDALLVPRDVVPGFTADMGSPGTSTRACGNVVLTTSRHVPVPLWRAYRLALDPLTPDATRDFFATALEQTFDVRDTEAVATIGAALGHLPLALELAAETIVARHIPLDMFASRLREHPLDRLLDGDGELHKRIGEALACVDASSRRRFTLLAALNAETFGVEAVSVLDAECAGGGPSSPAIAARESRRSACQPHPAGAGREPVSQKLDYPELEETAGEVDVNLATAAADLGELVRHSLLQLLPSAAATEPHARGGAESLSKEGALVAASHRYRIHPLVRAYAAEQWAALEPERQEQATRRVRDYALDFAERYRDVRARLECERDLLIPAVLAAEEAGQLAQARTLALRLCATVGRRGIDAEGEQAMLTGARAAHELSDRHALVLLLFRLGLLRYYRGAYRSARRIWEDALTFATGLDNLSYTRLPERGLGFLAAACGEQDEALRRAASYKQACIDEGNAMAAAGAMISHAFQLRAMGRPQQSQEDAQACASIVTPADRGEKTPLEHIVVIEAQLELARLAGDYQRAQELTQECFVLNQRYRDHFLAVDCLADQAEFAFIAGARQDARVLGRRVEEFARTIGAVGLNDRVRRLLDAS